MTKQSITVNMAGRPYTLVSTDPPEHVRRVAAYADRKLQETASVTNLPSAQTAVLTCLNLADELMRAQDENRVLRRQMEQAVETGLMNRPEAEDGIRAKAEET